MILSSFFWGYVIPQIGAGQLAEAYGPKYFLLVAMACNGLFSIFIPIFAAWYGEWGVMVCRIGQGLSQGFFFPSAHALIGKWAPPTERSRIGSLVYAGGSKLSYNYLRTIGGRPEGNFSPPTFVVAKCLQ